MMKYWMVAIASLCIAGCSMQARDEPSDDPAEVTATGDEHVSRTEQDIEPGRVAETTCPAGEKLCGLGGCGAFCCSGPPPPHGAGGLPCDVPCTRDHETGIVECRP